MPLEIWSINGNGLTTPYAQYDLLYRADKEGVHIIIIVAQETYFAGTYTIPLGQWLLISSGVLNKAEIHNNKIILINRKRVWLYI